MAAVRSTRNQSTELRLMALLRGLGITGWRRGSLLPGRPDFVFPATRVAIFVDGCFWHGCATHCRLPASNREYWASKVAANRCRDRRNARTLRQLGWRVLRVWEHELRPAVAPRVGRRLRRNLNEARITAPARRHERTAHAIPGEVGASKYSRGHRSGPLTLTALPAISRPCTPRRIP
ncbi:MAG: hypothetical protein RIQ93_2059 [Verrucomicrobiota bacterium]